MGLFSNADFLSEVIVFQILVFIWEWYLEYRQYSRSFMPQPENTKSIEPDTAEYAKSQQYSRAKLSFSLLTGWVHTFKELAFLWFFVFPQVWSSIGELVGEGSLVQPLIYFFGLSFFDSLFDMPFTLYQTFVIEERFGFNKTTARTFILDFLKSTALSICIGSPILTLFLYILELGGPQLWLYLWGFCIVLVFLFIGIKPTIIDPLFNTYSPLPEGELRTRIESLAKKLNFPLSQLFVVDGSTRSDHSNAYFFGFWNKRIVLFDTLLEHLSTDQIEAVLGHELGHWSCWHTYFQMTFTQAYLGVILYSGSSMIYTPELYESFGFQTRAPIIGLTLFAHLLGPLDSTISFLINYMTRTFEYQADNFAAHLGFAADLSQGLVQLAKKNLGNLNNDPLYSMYHFTHPTVPERLHALAPFLKKKC